jgi:alpha-D-xyloside xylohydrolase
VIRPLGFHYPDDPVARRVDDAFLLGRDLLVVPVFDDTDQPVQRTFYVPDGRWYDLNDEIEHAGPGYHTARIPLDRMPVLVREGAAVPRVEVDASVRNTADLATRPWTLHAYGSARAPRELVAFDGSRVSAGDLPIVQHAG